MSCRVRLPAGKVALAAAALASLASGVRGGTIRHDRADSQYTALTAQYPSVGALLFDFDPQTGDASGICSGTLITSQWVLTAAHCIDATHGDSLTFVINGEAVPVVERVPHPDWDPSQAGFDIGLARLATPVVGVSPSARLTVADPSTEFPEAGKTATLVGFGATGNGITGASSASAGTKRAGDNVFDVAFTVGGAVHYFGGDFDDPPSGSGYTNDGLNPFGSPTPLDLEYMLAGGDSGGGAFIDLGSGPLLAGVNAFITASTALGGDGNANSDYGDIFAATRVAEFNGFIDSVIPEPAGLAALAAGFVTLLRRRR